MLYIGWLANLVARTYNGLDVINRAAACWVFLAAGSLTGLLSRGTHFGACKYIVLDTLVFLDKYVCRVKYTQRVPVSPRSDIAATRLRNPLAICWCSWWCYWLGGEGNCTLNFKRHPQVNLLLSDPWTKAKDHLQIRLSLRRNCPVSHPIQRWIKAAIRPFQTFNLLKFVSTCLYNIINAWQAHST